MALHPYPNDLRHLERYQKVRKMGSCFDQACAEQVEDIYLN
jgi:hypothetical protein